MLGFLTEAMAVTFVETHWRAQDGGERRRLGTCRWRLWVQSERQLLGLFTR